MKQNIKDNIQHGTYVSLRYFTANKIFKNVLIKIKI